MDNKNAAPSLTDRMKGYEDAYKLHFTKRTPLVIRLEGINFKEYTSKYAKPFDEQVSYWMESTLESAVRSIPTCVFGFTIGDEINLFLRDWDKLNTAAWFNGNLQQIISTATSFVTATFNDEVKRSSNKQPFNGLALFRAHAYVLPKDEVVNHFIWRQHEGGRKSVQELGKSLYKNSVNVTGINNKNLIQMIEQDFPNQSWDSTPDVFRFGAAMRKDESTISRNLPLFKDDRQYIEELVYVKGD